MKTAIRLHAGPDGVGRIWKDGGRAHALSTYLSIAFEKEDRERGLNSAADAGISNHVLDRIDDACLRSGIPLAETFLSKWFVEYLDEAPPPEFEDRWFTPEEGLEWVRRVRQELDTYPNDSKNQAAISGLDGYQQQLRRALEAGVRWNMFAA